MIVLSITFLRGASVQVSPRRARSRPSSCRTSAATEAAQEALKITKGIQAAASFVQLSSAPAPNCLSTGSRRPCRGLPPSTIQNAELEAEGLFSLSLVPLPHQPHPPPPPPPPAQSTPPPPPPPPPPPYTYPDRPPCPPSLPSPPTPSTPTLCPVARPQGVELRIFVAIGGYPPFGPLCACSPIFRVEMTAFGPHGEPLPSPKSQVPGPSDLRACHEESIA